MSEHETTRTTDEPAEGGALDETEPSGASSDDPVESGALEDEDAEDE